MTNAGTPRPNLDASKFPTGWPRPLAEFGSARLPVPYIAGGDDHSVGDVKWAGVDPGRRSLVAAQQLCQVCGLEPGVTAWVVMDPMFSLDHLPGAGILDGACICDRCWPVARRLCPELANKLGKGPYEAIHVPVARITICDEGCCVALNEPEPVDQARTT